ncbi:hypothetical protein [Xanthobacter tagetidis]|jgi:hypothetical protein|nr:hypothetical protein [Xanthobacter tagetidis]MBB6309022.1 hypothetical protein [Xanthobacter tagetidis]
MLVDGIDPMERQMDEIRRLAYESVARACGFTFLAVICMMIGLSYEPGQSFRFGGIATLILCAALLERAHSAETRDHRRTEVWLHLEKSARPHEPAARRVVGGALREAYLAFARHTAACAAVLLTGSLLLDLASVL